MGNSETAKTSWGIRNHHSNILVLMLLWVGVIDGSVDSIVQDVSKESIGAAFRCWQAWKPTTAVTSTEEDWKVYSEIRVNDNTLSEDVAMEAKRAVAAKNFIVVEMEKMLLEEM
ncbi:hypothetical protein BDQ17DRAFT_1477507 [Cyathus striatus]|nr:hypothetical protein BDQ17DRAFT_1477507 [Cyathus striatus]